MILEKKNRDTDKKRDVFSIFLIFLTSSLIIGFSDLLISILFIPRFPAFSFSFLLKTRSITGGLVFLLEVILFIITVFPFF